MTIATLRSALPDWAKDLSLNLSTLTRATTLGDVPGRGRRHPSRVSPRAGLRGGPEAPER